MKFWIAILPLLLASACMVTDGEERLPTPTATSTQIMEMSAAEVQLDGEGRISSPTVGMGAPMRKPGARQRLPMRAES